MKKLFEFLTHYFIAIFFIVVVICSLTQNLFLIKKEKQQKIKIVILNNQKYTCKSYNKNYNYLYEFESCTAFN